MKNIYFVQVGFGFGDSVYLPYAAGTMIAYCRTISEINEEYSFSDIIFRREPLEEALARIKDPYMVAFSCSVWNLEYNRALARIIRRKYPGCIMVFGGHSVKEDGSFFSEEENADILMYGEGELTLAALLLALKNGEQLPVDNTAVKKDGKILSGKRSPIEDLSVLPSPYLDGTFNEIIKKIPGRNLLAVLETNRGCPYSCAYCDWCAGKKMRQFPLKKVLDEITWFSQNGIEYIFCADSNFGIFDRDVEIARALVSAKKKTGYPAVFRPCYDKNSTERVFEICSTLNEVGMDKGATMAYQTLNAETLKNIGRKNLTMEHFAELQKKYNEAGIPSYSELILGLPGETLDSFCDGICRLLENGQHNSINVYYCEMLPNALLSDKEYAEKHRIETMKVPFNHIHSTEKEDNGVQEYSYLIRSTATLSEEDWVNANLFSVTEQCFHSLGLLRCFSMYLYNEGILSYREFFSGLLDCILSSETRVSEMWRGFRQKYEDSFTGDWNYYNKRFGDVTWFFEEGAFLELASDFDSAFEELKPFLGKYLEEDMLEELKRYQKFWLRLPSAQAEKESFSYNFAEYFADITDGKKGVLKKEPFTAAAAYAEVYDNLPDYAREVVWYGRRRGATMRKIAKAD